MPVDKVLTVTSEIVSHPTNLHNLHTVLTFIILVSSLLVPVSEFGTDLVFSFTGCGRDLNSREREQVGEKEWNINTIELINHLWVLHSVPQRILCASSPLTQCNEFIVSVSRKYGDKLRSCCSLKWRILSQQATSVRCKTVAFQKHILPRRRRRNREHRDRRYSNYSSESLSLFVTCPRRYHLNNTAMFKR